jgi:Flp pilus assembly protein TadD
MHKIAASWRRRGAVAALAMLLGSCSYYDEYFGKSAMAGHAKSDLAGPLIAAAATAKSQNDMVTAVTYYRSALAREPDNVEAQVGLMQSLRISGALDEARGVAASVIARKPTDPAVLAEAGKVKLATGQLDDAVRLLKLATAADPKNATTIAALGLAYDRLGEYAHADQYYEQALAIAPSDAYVLNDYALSRVMANDLGDALKLLQRAAAAPNADLRVRQNLALVYALTGDMTTAEQETKRDLPPVQASQAMQYFRQFAAPEPAQVAAVPPPSQPPAVPPSRVAALATDQLVTATPRIDPVTVSRMPPVAPSPQTAPVVGDQFAVQLGSYRSEAAAQHAVAAFDGKGVAGRLARRHGSDGRDWYIVVSAGFANRDEAENILPTARSAGAVRPFVLHHRPADRMPAKRVAASHPLPHS